MLHKARLFLRLALALAHTHTPSTDTRAGDAPIAVDCWSDPSES